MSAAKTNSTRYKVGPRSLTAKFHTTRIDLCSRLRPTSPGASTPLVIIIVYDIDLKNLSNNTPNTEIEKPLLTLSNRALKTSPIH
ncbi:hypothetical protein PoB_001487600 [Plakobranchus ocellatus]|uniref:Uncharacterized protein n=1 Tax=Plakobranchus ocellatus TaxID=259542 RepID=A0AAV3YM96_9GAST|nr:hypothetical protein PoB_001487600 [Plakobranchus ocellatus]